MSVPNYAMIEIDATKCTTPFDCKACLTACQRCMPLNGSVRFSWFLL